MTEKQLQKEANNKLYADNYVWWYPKRTWGERDVFGIYDFLAIHRKTGKLIMVQITTLDHVSHRRKKIQDFYLMNAITTRPRNVFIWAWDKRLMKFRIKKV